MKDVIEELRTLRRSYSMSHSWYIQADSLATKVDVVPCVPRTAAYQQHRDNVEHSSAEKYYRRTIVLPLLDHLVQQMEMRFAKSQVLVARLVNLVPSINATLLTFHMRK